MRKVTAYIERDTETGFYVGTVPSIPGAHTYAKSLDELSTNLKEVVELCLEEMSPELKDDLPEFIGIQQLEVAILNRNENNICQHDCLYIDYKKYESETNPEKLDVKKFETAINEKKLSGTCIFVDMVGSTKIKTEKSTAWVAKIKNTIVTANIDYLRNHIVKVNGDELMIFIPDKCFLENTDLYDRILGNLISYMRNYEDWASSNLREPITKTYFLRLKASIHHTDDAYCITFFENQKPDYYGNGIDLTARLITKSYENEITISREYFKKLKNTCIENIQITDFPTGNEFFKGFQKETYFTTINIK